MNDLVTIAGWFVAGYIGARLAHHSQRKLMRENHQRTLSREVMDECNAVANVLVNLRGACDNYMFHATGADIAGSTEGFDFALDFQAVNRRYRELSEIMRRLKFWLDVTGRHIPNADGLIDIHRYYEEHYVETLPVDDNLSDWTNFILRMQGHVAGSIGYDVLWRAWEPVMESLVNISDGVVVAASNINDALMPNSTQPSRQRHLLRLLRIRSQ